MIMIRIHYHVLERSRAPEATITRKKIGPHPRGHEPSETKNLWVRDPEAMTPRKKRRVHAPKATTQRKKHWIRAPSAPRNPPPSPARIPIHFRMRESNPRGHFWRSTRRSQKAPPFSDAKTTSWDWFWKSAERSRKAISFLGKTIHPRFLGHDPS